MADKKGPDGRRFNRPPENSKFKRGQSGNRKGRPKSQMSGMSSIFDEASSQLVTVIAANGKRIKMTKTKAAAHQLVNAALKGEIRAIRACIEMIRKLENAGVFRETQLLQFQVILLP